MTQRELAKAIIKAYRKQEQEREQEAFLKSHIKIGECNGRTFYVSTEAYERHYMPGRYR